MRRLVAVAAAASVAALLSAVPAAACSVCYGEASDDSPLVAGAQMGIALLLGVTTLMLGGFAAFFLHLRNRARRVEIDSGARDWAPLRRSVTP